MRINNQLTTQIKGRDKNEQMEEKKQCIYYLGCDP